MAFKTKHIVLVIAGLVAVAICSIATMTAITLASQVFIEYIKSTL